MIFESEDGNGPLTDVTCDNCGTTTTVPTEVASAVASLTRYHKWAAVYEGKETFHYCPTCSPAEA